jgi:hypothetical protein
MIVTGGSNCQQKFESQSDELKYEEPIRCPYPRSCKPLTGHHAITCCQDCGKVLRHGERSLGHHTCPPRGFDIRPLFARRCGYLAETRLLRDLHSGSHSCTLNNVNVKIMQRKKELVKVFRILRSTIVACAR